tara:strand:- start:25561 stop:25719 length:159 start_codon:yes stop_codon:yes gene_type:complete
MGIIKNLTIYLVLIATLGMLFLFFIGEKRVLNQEEITVQIDLPDKINICSAH